MKHRFGVAFLLLLVLPDCTTDFDLINESSSLPVVYCQLNPQNQESDLTLTRTFIGKASGYDLAQDSSKVFFQSANIRLEGWVDDFKVWESVFKPVGKSKLQGIFTQAPGYFYRCDLTGSIIDITSFRLVFEHPDLPSPAYSKIEVIGPPIIKSKYDKQVSLYPGSYDIGIAPGPGTAYCDLKCVFRYQQYVDDWEDRSDTILLRRDIRFEAGRTDFLYPELFFKQIAANIKPINDSIIRKFTSLDLILYAGDQHFRDYVDTFVNAGDLDLPPKGNIINGLGLFTMVRIGVKKDMTFDRITFDSLCLGQYTKHLGFVRW